MTRFLTSPELGFPPSRILLSEPEAVLGSSAAARRSTTSAASPRAPMGTTARAKPGSGAGTEVVAASSTPSAPRRRAITPAATRRRVGERSEIPGEGVAGRAGWAGSGGGIRASTTRFLRPQLGIWWGSIGSVPIAADEEDLGLRVRPRRGREEGDLGEKAFEFRGCRVRCAQVLFVAVTGQTRGAPRGPWWLGLRSFSGNSVRSTHNLSCGLDQNFAEFCRPIWATGCQRVREVWECCCCYQLRERKKSKKKGRNKV